LLVFSPLGTPSNTAIQKYLNAKQVPQLFVASGATKWGDPQNFPWTMGWQPSYQTESRIFARYILQNKPDGKVALMYQNDEYGKDYLKGLKDGLGDKAVLMIVAEESYEPSEPTIDSHIVKLKSSGADVFVNFSTPKFAAQAIKKAAEIGWKPTHFLNSVSASVGAVMKPAGLDNSQGIISAAYSMDPTDPQWKDHAATREWTLFMEKYYPGGDTADSINVFGYNLARTLVQVLAQCGNDLTRKNVMKQAASLRDFIPGLVLPGIRINTSPTDFYPIEQMQLMKFDGVSWKLFGPIASGAANG
jgi:branched-chain amino acid transport system substrate-binding protein